MSAEEIGKKLVELCNKGENLKAIDTLYSLAIVSVETMAIEKRPAEMRGIEAVRAKSVWWLDNHTVHSGKALGPFVARNQFAVTFENDATQKATGKRFGMTEIGLYTVEGDKIIRDECFYKACAPA